MSAWTILVCDPVTHAAIDTIRCDDEDDARKKFAELCEKARVEGGAYELRHAGKWLTFFAVSLPDVKGAP